MTGPSCCEDKENHKITDGRLNLSNHLEHWFSKCGPQKTWVQSLGWEDTLEKGRAAHSSVLAWRIPWTEEPGKLQSMGLQRVGHCWVTFTFKCCEDEENKITDRGLNLSNLLEHVFSKCSLHTSRISNTWTILLGRQIFRPHHRPTELETLGMGAQSSKKSSWWL